MPIATRGAMPMLEVDLLPSWLASWARAISAEKGAALDLGANLALGAVSGGIARNVQVSPRPGWNEPVNLYVITALAPGQAKSPVFKAALRPVRTLERQRMQEWSEAGRRDGAWWRRDADSDEVAGSTPGHLARRSHPCFRPGDQTG